MIWQNSVNGWTKIAAIAGGVGGLLGGLGAFVAIFLLSGNLSELKKQTEFENKGFLAFNIVGAEADTLPRRLRLKYKLVQVSRVPLSLTGPALGMTSKTRQIDFQDWVKAKEQTLEGQPAMRIPILEDTVSIAEFTLHTAHLKPDSIKPAGQDSIGYYGFFLHLLYKYRDITNKEYWSYMRWSFDLTSRDFDDNKLKKFEGSIRPEYWDVWEAKSNEIIPHKFPRNLLKIGKGS